MPSFVFLVSFRSVFLQIVIVSWWRFIRPVNKTITYESIVTWDAFKCSSKCITMWKRLDQIKYMTRSSFKCTSNKNTSFSVPPPIVNRDAKFHVFTIKCLHKRFKNSLVHVIDCRQCRCCLRSKTTLLNLQGKCFKLIGSNMCATLIIFEMEFVSSSVAIPNTLCVR